MYLEQRVNQLEKLLEIALGEIKKLKDEKNSISKSNNELRKDIIEKAKNFIKHNKSKSKSFNYSYENKDGYESGCNVEFIINNDSKIVVALLKGYETGKLYSKGIARCLPEDVFNQHIGKAIALGRALKLDVSEFENAINPDKFEHGMIIEEFHDNGRSFKHMVSKCLVNEDYMNEKLEHYYNNTFNENGVNCRIVEDTNAEY